jgi:hypothetical protein
MRDSILLATLIAAFAATAAAQTPPASPPQPPGAQRPAAPPGGPGGQGRRGIAVMTLTSSAWADGGMVPVKYSQAGPETSPPFSWSDVPDGAASFVLMMRDLDAASGPGTEEIVHWMLWNIPGAALSLPEGLPQATQLPDGTRQMSATGPYYRGPGAPSAGPAHHYVYALDTAIDVPPVGQSPAATRAAILAAMAGHVRGKAVYVGLFKR